jgi:hypothetical protein
MLYIVAARWSMTEAGNAYFGPFTKDEADAYLQYLVEGQPASARASFFIKELTPALDDYRLEKISKGITKGSKTAIPIRDIKIDQDFLYYGVRHRRIHASTPDAEHEMVHNRGVIPAMAMEGKNQGCKSGIPKDYLVEPL